MYNIVIFVVLACLLDTCWSELFDPRAHNEMPANCTNQVYCTEKDEHYPIGDVKTTLERNNDQLRNLRQVKDWCDRRNSDPAVMSECGVGECGVRVYYVKDELDHLRVVLQSEEKGYEFKQLYDITKCQTEGPVTKTAHFTSGRLRGHTMNCYTSYSSYHFLVLSRNGIGVDYVKAKLPVCCKCILTKK